MLVWFTRMYSVGNTYIWITKNNSRDQEIDVGKILNRFAKKTLV